jgi:acyl-CoA thioesterase II
VRARSPWSDLLTCLDPKPVPSGGTGDEVADDDVTEFEGRNRQLEYHRVFGGQPLGQFIRIASATRPGKAVKSQHAMFAREGRADDWPLLRQEALLRFAS